MLRTRGDEQPERLAVFALFYRHKKAPIKGLVSSISDDYGFVVVVAVPDLLAVSLSLLDELSDAFLATRATIIAGQPASDTTTGTAINQHPIFTNLFIFYVPLVSSISTASLRQTI